MSSDDEYCDLNYGIDTEFGKSFSKNSNDAKFCNFCSKRRKKSYETCRLGYFAILIKNFEGVSPHSLIFPNQTPASSLPHDFFTLGMSQFNICP